jgi:hypothetical protein
MIRFECPHCGHYLRTDDAMIGAAFNCPRCRGRVRVPHSGVQVASAGRDSRQPAQSRFKVKPVASTGGVSAGRVALLFGAPLGVIAGGVLALVIGSSPTEFRFWMSIGFGSLAGVIVALIFAVRRNPARCARCRRRTETRRLGSIRRDAQSAKEALEAGDLASLRALSAEGATIEIEISQCRHCQYDAPIDVVFLETGDETRDADNRKLAHVTYPGIALPAFERLCRLAEAPTGD